MSEFDINRLKKKDLNEWDKFLKKYGKHINGICQKFGRTRSFQLADCEDICQRTLMKLFEKRSKLRTDGNIIGLGRSIAIGLFLNDMKSSKLRANSDAEKYNKMGHVELEKLDGKEKEEKRAAEKRTIKRNSIVIDILDKEKGNPVLMEVFRKEQKEHIHKILSTLPLRDRAIYKCFYEQDMSYKETGKELGVQRNYVRDRLLRIRDKIGELLPSSMKGNPE